MSSLRRARDRNSSSDASIKSFCLRFRWRQKTNRPTPFPIGSSHSTPSPWLYTRTALCPRKELRATASPFIRTTFPTLTGQAALGLLRSSTPKLPGH
ncbi:hypothetical protein FOFC_17530 [Fusarium oxysporum]|nr:hypothetical protein FOFC_17530 [Fusarium oxysporum]